MKGHFQRDKHLNVCSLKWLESSKWTNIVGRREYLVLRVYYPPPTRCCLATHFYYCVHKCRYRRTNKLTFDIVEAEGNEQGEPIKQALVLRSRPHLFNLITSNANQSNSVTYFFSKRIHAFVKEKQNPKSRIVRFAYLDGERRVSEEVIELRVYQRRDRIDGHGCVPVVDSEENEGRVLQ